uniref:ARAD1B04620p n=1 Tax=Blastobotrys adeninivorans TaxID=409370 RepID=A0A060T4M8_BLAAD
MENRHLFVLVHGFFGNPSHLKCMQQTFLDKWRPEDGIETFIPTNNSGLRSFDGVYLGAERCLVELEQFLIARHKADKVKFTKISFVGYSMGGLVARALVGMLYERGFFSNVEPFIFCTFASPHLGSKFNQESLRGQILNFLGSNFLGISGRDMFGHYSEVLDQLADPELRYMKALQKFPHLMLFSNAVHDRTVPFFTSFIADRDPFQTREYMEFVYFDTSPKSEAASSTSRGEDDPFFVDMRNSRMLAEISSKEIVSTRDERRMQTFLTLVIPWLLPIALALTSVTTVFSYVRAYQAEQAKRLDPSGRYLLRNHEAHSEGLAELAYYSIDEALLEEPERSPTPSTKESQTFRIASSRKGSKPLVKPTVGDGYEGLMDSTKSRLPVDDRTKRWISSLNKLPWEKYVVRLRRMHSHAEIVNRRNKPGQGQRLLEIFVDLVEDKLHEAAKA